MVFSVNRKRQLKMLFLENAETDSKKLKRIDMGDKDSIEEVAGDSNVQPREQQ